MGKKWYLPRMGLTEQTPPQNMREAVYMDEIAKANFIYARTEMREAGMRDLGEAEEIVEAEEKFYHTF